MENEKLAPPPELAHPLAIWSHQRSVHNSRLVDMLHNVAQSWSRDQSQLASVMFVEFAKAFDPVDHIIQLSSIILLNLLSLV